MRLLELLPNGDIRLAGSFLNHAIPRYAILSHTWGPDSEEVTFGDLVDGLGRSKAGYSKIMFCGKQAARDGLQYFWVDTCCINKLSNTELSEAINSIFRWYQHAERCYVYLSDVSTTERKRGDKKAQSMWEQAFRQSIWFTRSWTLQELIAPASVRFFSREGFFLGDKLSLEQQIHEATGIALTALRGSPMSHFTVAERLSWTSRRSTTREEDLVYSLLGLFGITMPLLYGESRAAFVRFTEEIMKASEDHSILLCSKRLATSKLWRPTGLDSSGLNWEGLKVHSPNDLMSIDILRPHLPPLSQVPGLPQTSSRGLRVSLYTKRVNSSLISWTYCTQEKDGQFYAICIGVLYEGDFTEANRSYVKGTISGDIYYVKVNRLKGFELRYIYLSHSEDSQQVAWHLVM